MAVWFNRLCLTIISEQPLCRFLMPKSDDLVIWLYDGVKPNCQTEPSFDRRNRATKVVFPTSA